MGRGPGRGHFRVLSVWFQLGQDLSIDPRLCGGNCGANRVGKPMIQ